MHGIRIEFVNDKGHHKTATYLPEVSLEQSKSNIVTYYIVQLYLKKVRQLGN